MMATPPSLEVSRGLDDAPRLREARTADRAFLLALYASTREAELAQAGWPEDMRRVFVQMQYAAQQAGYTRTYPNSRCQVIETGGAAVGRLWVAREQHALQILDISLAPAHRGRGIGSACLIDVLRQARVLRLPVELHVLRGNPAQALYERLGFRCVGEPGVYQAMTSQAPLRESPATHAFQAREIQDEQA